MNLFDAAVIGSGPNGLAAAIRLTQAGRSVVVLEASDTIGGGARTQELTETGFLHDVCSAIHPMGIGSPFLSTLDLESHGLEWIHPLAPLAHPMDDGPAALLERDLEATAATLGADGKKWVRWMKPWIDRWEGFAVDALAPLGIPKHPIWMASFGMQAMRSAVSLAESRFDTPEGKALFGGVAAHSVMPLDMTPSAAIGMMLTIAGHAVGWPLPKGGAQSIPNALASLFRSLGGTIQTGIRVTDLEQVPTKGPILFETAPARLADIAGNNLPLAFRKSLQNYRHGPGVFKIDYALDGPIPWRDETVLRAGTVHLGGTLEEMALSEACAWKGKHAAKPYVLVAQQSLFDPTRAPTGKHTGWAYCHVPRGSTKDMTQAIESQIERFAPGFKDQVLARHTMHSLAFETYNPNYVGGDVNGGEATIDQLFQRPTRRTYRTPNPRIFLCSAATPPGGGIHGMCGHHAAQAALRHWPD
ncbi:MAG: FAD-dependent oxidoreductase [Deltaproteobacteria bacterium]|nr:FAD-dependent oxidoreductase [Deltaproteobacteria bacterium]